MPQRVIWLDFARGISIVLVVVFHASIEMQKIGATHPIYWLLNDFVAPIRMPVFFFVSGYLGRNVILKPWRELASGKIVLLFYLFVLWSVLNVMVRVAFGIKTFPDAGELVRLVYSPSSVLWFIWALAFYFAIARAGFLAGRLLVMMVATALSAFAYLGVIHFDNYVHANLLKFLPFFLFGAWYSERLIGHPMFGRIWAPILAFAIFVPAFAIAYRDVLPGAVERGFMLPLAVLGLLVGITGSILACRSKVVRAVPAFVGRNTLPIYLAHSPIIALLAYEFGRAIQATPHAQLWAVPVLSVVAAALSLLLKEAAEQLGGWWFYAAPTFSGRPVMGGEKPSH